MADFIPTVTRDSNGFLMLDWPTNQRGETMVAREVMVQMIDDLNRLRAEVKRKADYAERMDALAEERLIESNRLRAAVERMPCSCLPHAAPNDGMCNRCMTLNEEARRG